MLEQNFSRGYMASDHAAVLRPRSLDSSRRPLIFELIPLVMHGRSVRAVLATDIWRLLRKITLDRDGGRCGECGSVQSLECHEVWQYLPPRHLSERSIMKLTRLRTLCHLCHLGKHIGYALRNPKQYCKVRKHLMDLYELPSDIYSQLEQLAFLEVSELNKAGLRALDLTYLNSADYLWITHRYGRPFSNDETDTCTYQASHGDVG